MMMVSVGLVGADPDPWGPRVRGGRRWRLLRRLATVLGVLSIVGVTAVATTGFLLLRQAEASLTRVPVEQLEVATAPTDARHFLVVGSDGRDGLDDEARSQLRLGSFDGQRSDTVIYVAISADRSTVSLVSLPRDLLVMDDGRQRKLTDTFTGGPDHLIRVLRENFGLPVNHYAQVSLGGFVEVVRTLGGVSLCLDEPLRDRKSGADFDAGCHDMSAEEALSYVRSRQGARADFERIDRQQQFLRAMLSEMVDARILTDVPRLFRLVEDVASNVTTDEGLGVNQIRGLADEMRQVLRDGVPMTTFPGYPRRIDGLDYVVAYGPGARAMLEDLRAGRPIADRGTRDQRADTAVAVLSGGRAEGTEIVSSTLMFAGFQAGWAGVGSALDAGETTTVYRLPGHEQEAEWVAAALGAPIRALPTSTPAPEGANVVVTVGEDATS
jgi:LCP family protein required for cell wall assembly